VDFSKIKVFVFFVNLFYKILFFFFFFSGLIDVTKQLKGVTINGPMHSPNVVVLLLRRIHATLTFSSFCKYTTLFSGGTGF